MKLDKPALPISFSPEDAKAQIEDDLNAKNWKEFEISEPVLLYVPFFVFNYEAFTESKTEESETPVVSETETGRMALNAFTGELNEEVAGLLDDQELALEKKATKEHPFELQKARLKDEEARQIAQVKLAAQMSLGKDNIIISAIEMIYVPMWVFSVAAGEQDSRVEVNAVSGAMTGFEELPERGKGYGELTKETISELKSPAAWVQYSFSIVADTAKWIWNSGPVKYLVQELATNRRLQISLLLCIIILLALREAGYL